MDQLLSYPVLEEQSLLRFEKVTTQTQMRRGIPHTVIEEQKPRRGQHSLAPSRAKSRDAISDEGIFEDLVERPERRQGHSAFA